MNKYSWLEFMDKSGQIQHLYGSESSKNMVEIFMYFRCLMSKIVREGNSDKEEGLF